MRQGANSTLGIAAGHTPNLMMRLTIPGPSRFWPLNRRKDDQSAPPPRGTIE